MANETSKLDYFQVEIEQSKQLAIPLNQTTEVFSVQRGEICPIPGVKPSLLGVISKRGNLLWMLDFNRMLGMVSGHKKLHYQDKLTTIILTKNEQKVGCVVNKLKGIIEIGETEFTKPSWQANFFLAETLRDTYPVSILDINAVFASLG